MKSLERSDAGSFVSSSDISDSDDGFEENPAKEHSREEKSKVPTIAKQENIYVFRWRIMVVVMMIVTAALVLTSTFLFLQREETGKFESAFLQSASTIAGASQFYTRNTLESLRNLGDALTSEAITSNLGTGSQNQSSAGSPLPLYTSPTFEIQAAHARFNSFTEIMVYAPRIAPGAQRDAWEEYSPKHYAEWMHNSKELVKETQPWFERDRMNTMMTGEAGAAGGGTIGAGEGYMGGNDNLWLGGEGGDNTFVVVADGDEQQGHVRRRRLEADDDMFMADDGFGPNAGTAAEAGSPDGSAGAQSESEPVEPPLVPLDDGEGLDFVDRIYRFKSTGSERDRRFNDQGDAFQRFKGRSRVASVAATDQEVYVPIWEISPPPQNATVLNFDLMKHKVFRNAMNGVVNSGGHPGFSDFLCLDFLFDQIMTPAEHWKYHAGFNSDPITNANAVHEASNHPHSLAVGVVRRDFEADAPIVGHVISVIPWDLYMTNLLPVGENGVYAVVENKCGTNVTYVVNGKTATFLGVGDLHDRQFDYLKVSKSLSDDVSFPIATGDGICVYDIHLYPSTVYKSLHYDKTQAAMFTAILAAVFVATGLVFFIFVRYVQRRQDKVMRTAIKTDAIVSSMFPEQVRDRLFGNDDEDDDDDHERADTTSQRSLSKHGKLKEFMEAGKRLEDDEDDDDCDSCFQPAYKTKPIADLFPEATILFADLVGFTSWSSAREPTQVFILLETIYHMYDQFARKRRIFKVETIGDCYVAVTGLPDPRKDHAIAMCRFANDCCSRLADLLRSLEVTLGPDTGDLSMRFGLHSGPVTAGVLRGDKGRFQLFGDTMNTAARMEHTGVRGKIQLSKETATILENSGKSHWIVPRADLVEAKGKGTLQTYWLEMKGSSSGTDSTTRTMSETSGEYFNEQDINLTLMGLADAQPNPDGGQTSETAAAALDGKTMRLVDWNVETLLGMLRQVVAHRRAIGTNVSVVDEDKILNEIHAQLRRKSPSNDVGTTVVDEVQECIHLPTDKTSPPQQQESKPKDIIKLGPNVENELRDFVMAIAAAYRNNPFHNFEHASHVAMSVSKLISRIAETDEEEANRRSSDEVVSALSHPLTQFSCVFSALLHDVDHSGVTNAQLIKEKADVAEIYKGTAIAEQNSVDVGWELLLDDRYKNLRQTIYANEAEFKRFRLLVVNSVMATDIFDGDLKKIRNERWNKAFIAGSEQKNLVDRKATIVIEHLMQASDVSHTMQHWHIYRKWNERLFREQSFAYETGRGGDRDPVEYWYKGEIDFFDHTILPLAKKLKECGVFGGSSFEYLNYAEHNREEWVAKGKKIVEEMKEKMQAEVKAGRCRPSVHNRKVWADMKQTLEAEIKAADSALLCNARAAAASARHDADKAEEEEEQGRASVGTTSTTSSASSSDAPTNQQHVECEEESLSEESDSMAC